MRVLGIDTTLVDGSTTHKSVKMAEILIPPLLLG
jgi:hypothetical protein